MNPPNAPRTARERARTELSREIREEARRQLAAVGATGLSLRAVARELGMVSSALYRYYPSRDDLLTALIVDAYNSLGEAAESAGAGPGTASARWTATCVAIRDWALARPHEYALIYGSPVPGYRAPETTIGPAVRVPLVLVGILADAVSAGELLADTQRSHLADALTAQSAALLTALSASAPRLATVPPDALVRAVIAWTQLIGMISFELFGQFVGSFDPTDAFFAHTVTELCTFVGFR